MEKTFERLAPYAPYAMAITRIVAGLLFIQHGTNKLFAWPETASDGGPFILFGRVGLAGLMDFLGGILMVLGLWTRPVAFLLCGEMAYAYWFFYFPRSMDKLYGFMPFINRGDLSIMFCFTWFWVMFAGAGPWSLDAVRKRCAALNSGA